MRHPSLLSFSVFPNRFQTSYSIHIFHLRQALLWLCSGWRTRPRSVSMCCQCVYPKCKEERWQRRRLTLQGGFYQTAPDVKQPGARRNWSSWAVLLFVKESLLKEEHTPQRSATIHSVSQASQLTLGARVPVLFQASLSCHLCFPTRRVSCQVTKRLREPLTLAGSCLAWRVPSMRETATNTVTQFSHK